MWLPPYGLAKWADQYEFLLPPGCPTLVTDVGTDPLMDPTPEQRTAIERWLATNTAGPMLRDGLAARGIVVPEDATA